MKINFELIYFVLMRIYWTFFSYCQNVFYYKIGFNSRIINPMMVINKRYIYLGNNILIRDGARIEAYMENIKGKTPSIVIHDNVSIEQHVHIISGGGLSIGKNTTISANVFISNLNHSYSEKDVHILKQKKMLKETYIGENCFIGYGSCVLPGTILGKQCIVGANSVVRGVFPDYSVIAGNPAKLIRNF